MFQVRSPSVNKKPSPKESPSALWAYAGGNQSRSNTKIQKGKQNPGLLGKKRIGVPSQDRDAEPKSRTEPGNEAFPTPRGAAGRLSQWRQELAHSLWVYVATW